jgi:hypothetical protein
VSLWTRGISSHGWVGVDLDGTLATFELGQWPKIGEPVPSILETVEQLLADGREVRIMTARVGGLFKPDVSVDEYEDAVMQKLLVEKWCHKHLGRALPVTAVKDYDMDLLLDDRAVAVEKNTGRTLTFL